MHSGRGPFAFWESVPATPLLDAPQLAQVAGVARVLIKNEAERPLGNFKVLGGTFAAFQAVKRNADELLTSTDDVSFSPHLICASDGNHGLAVASAAQILGAPATVYLPRTASQVRVERITAAGARVVIVEGTYDDAVLAAGAAASDGGGLLIPDTTADPLDPVVQDVMTGYGQMTDELAKQFAAMGDGVRPTHAFIQAGVGGLAAAIASGLSAGNEKALRVVVVEPYAAACVARALQERRPVRIAGSLETIAEMLSCGLASAPALEVLLQHGAESLLVDEAQLASGQAFLKALAGLASTASSAAGLAGLMAAASDPTTRQKYGLENESVVLLCNTEGPEGAVSSKPP